MAIVEAPHAPHIRVQEDNPEVGGFDSGDENSIAGVIEEEDGDNDTDEEVDEPLAAGGVPAYVWTDSPIRRVPTMDTRQGPVPVHLDTLKPKFVPRPSQCGPQNVGDGPHTVLSMFLLFWCTLVCQTFIDATNAYARDTQKLGWEELTLPEFYAFIGIILFMGVVKLPSRAMHWQNGIFNQSYVTTVMPRNRFDSIIACWHWVNTAPFTDAERGAKNRQNSFWSIIGVVDILRTLFKKYYRLFQSCDIDEQTIGFKGRHRAKCYNPNKPQKWHFKVYVLSCAVTCYMYDFLMYQGKDERRPNGLSATVYPVWALMQDVILHCKNHILYIDNWYTGLEVVEICRKWGIHVTGTVRINKKHLPKEALFPKTGRNVHRRGDMRMLVANLHDSIEKVFFLAWQDNKPVHFLTSFPAYITTVVRHNRLANGTHVESQVPQPTTTAYYNAGMGGTDGFDAFISFYKTTLKTMKWQPRIFTHFLHASVINSQIIYCSVMGLVRGDDGFTLLSYTEMLIEALCEPWIATRNARKAKAPRKGNTVSCVKMDTRPEELHVPGQSKRSKVESPQGSDIWITGPENRRQCKVCNTRTNVKCLTCDVHLCLINGDDNTCWAHYHRATENSDEVEI
jgi:hypothetical protein